MAGTSQFRVSDQVPELLLTPASFNTTKSKTVLALSSLWKASLLSV